MSTADTAFGRAPNGRPSRLLGGRVDVGERAGMRAAAVAHRPLLLVLEPRLGLLAAIASLAAVDDDGHVRILLVVVHHLRVQLDGKLATDHETHHARLIVGRNPARATPAEV